MYAHETTHLLASCKNVNSTWMDEDLTVYLNGEFSAYPTWPIYTNNLDLIAKRMYENGYRDQVQFQNEYCYTFHDRSRLEGEAYYILAGSFVKYIITNVGINRYMAAYKSYSAASGSKNDTDKTLEQWKSEWIRYLKDLK